MFAAKVNFGYTILFFDQIYPMTTFSLITFYATAITKLFRIAID